MVCSFWIYPCSLLKSSCSFLIVDLYQLNVKLWYFVLQKRSWNLLQEQWFVVSNGEVSLCELKVCGCRATVRVCGAG